MDRHQLDEAFPTIVRYTGLALTVTLVFAGLFGYGLTVLAPGFVAATGMILYKTVRDAADKPMEDVHSDVPPSKMTMSLGFPMPNPEYDKWLEEEKRRRDG